MPYIKDLERKKFDKDIDKLAKKLRTSENPNLFSEKKSSVGNLNYIITKLIIQSYGPIENLKYNDFNEIIGILECAKLEFYRRMVAPYEDIKEKENGSLQFEEKK